MKKILSTLVAMSLVMASFSQNLSRCDGEQVVFFVLPEGWNWAGVSMHVFGGTLETDWNTGIQMEYIGNRHFKTVFHGHTITNTWNIYFRNSANFNYRQVVSAPNIVAGGVYRGGLATHERVVEDCINEVRLCEGDQIIFFRNIAHWPNVRIYVFGGSWPGTRMTHVRGLYYKFVSSVPVEDFDGIIFSNNGASQTPNITTNIETGSVFLPTGARDLERVIDPVVCIFPPTAYIATISDLNRESIGQITVTVTGGTNAPFTVDIGGTVTSDVALDDPVVRSNLVAGTYTVTVTCSEGLEFIENVVVARVCQGAYRSNLGAFSTSHADFGLVALGESLTITINPEYLSPCLGLTPGDHLYVRPFYTFRQSPGGTVYREITFTGWGLNALNEDFRMTFANGVYTFTIDNILEFLETGTSDIGAGSIPFDSWMTHRPMRMGFHFFYSDGNGGYSVIRTSLDQGPDDDFRVGLTQDYALSFWILSQPGRVGDDYASYFVGEDVNFRYERRLRFDNAWNLDGGNYKRYAIHLYANGANVGEIPSDVVFVGGNHDRLHRLTTAGNFRFEAKAVTPGGESWARYIGDGARLYHDVRAHAPVITLSASAAEVVEGETITITATIPFAHPNDQIMIELALDPNDFTGVSSSAATITIPSGSRSGTVQLVAVNDGLRTDSYRTATVGATGLHGFGGLLNVDFELYGPIQIDIEDVDANCPPPPAPTAAGVTVCINTNSAIFTVENHAIFGDPTFTLWTSETDGTQISLTVSGATPHTYSFVAPADFTANTTLYIEMQDAALTSGCHVSLRGTLNISVVEAPSDFTTNSFLASQGASDGGIEFTPGVRGLGPFTITIGAVTMDAPSGAMTTFGGLAAGYHDATITATANPVGCQTYTIYQIYVEQSACFFPATPTLEMANVCLGFDYVLVAITNHTAGITYRLVSSADDILEDDITVDSENRIRIETQAAGTFYLRAINSSLEPECQISTGRIHVLTVHSAPTTPQITFDGSVCVGETVEVTITNFDITNYSYALHSGDLFVRTITAETFETPAITSDTMFSLRRISRVTNIPADCRFSVADIVIAARPLPVFTAVPTHTYDEDGSIVVTVTSGSAPFSVVFAGETTNNVALNAEVTRIDLAPNTYTILVTDVHGCEASATAEVELLVVVPPTFGEGPAGVYFRVDNVINQRFRLNDISVTWVSGDMGNAPVLAGHDFGTVEDFYFSWARAIAWAQGDACATLSNRFVVFYRLTNNEAPNTPWISARLDHCDAGIYAGDNARLRTQPGTASNPFQAVNLIAMAYELGGYGTYTLEMAMVFDANSHTMDVPPTDRIRTATFTIEAEPVVVLTKTPAAGATGVGLNAPVTVTFSQDVDLSTPHGITISGGVVVTLASVTDNVLTIVHEGFTYETVHTVTIPNGAIVGYDAEISWSFTTVQDGLPIVVEAKTPADEATNVALNAAITVTFNQDIALNTPHGITISDDVTITSASVAGRVLTIVHGGLVYETTHTVTIPVGAIIGGEEAISWSFTTVNRPAATFGEGPAGVYFRVDNTDNVRFRLNDEVWSQGPEDMGGSPVLQGYDFGTLDEFYFSWARARAWSYGDACAVLGHKFVVFYRLTNEDYSNTPWTAVHLDYCNAAIYTGNNIRLRTQTAWEAVDIRALAYELAGYGTYTLEMAMVFYANSHAMDAPPTNRIRTATFTIVEEAEPTPIAIVQRTPATGATNVALDASITVTFNQDVELNTPHNITISGGVTVTSASVSGDVLTIVHSGFTYATTHTVTIPVGAIANQSDVITWSFTTRAAPPTSIIETSDVRLVVYPNPVVDILHIENPTNELLIVEIYTLSGVRIATFTNVTNTIDLSQLPSGTYLLRVGTRVVRIVKN